jgi:nifR3 family TIM-barrel protein
VQIAGTDAPMMAEAAAYNIDQGAQIIDINMGCPAKKVCNKWAGSALMQNESLAIEIAQAVVAACTPRGVPVTLKMRTGWCDTEKNALTLAKAFEGVGIQMVTVHGRTREQGYKGFAEYDTVAAVKAALKIPVVANGDIDSPEKALQVLKYTGADALMVGRAAQGRPWIFREIVHFLATGEHLAPPLVAEVRRLLLAHLEVRGVVGTSWFFDPQLDAISPRLSYLRKPLERGAFLVPGRSGAFDIASATVNSDARRQLFEQGHYMPVPQTLVWPRKELLLWARSLDDPARAG